MKLSLYRTGYQNTISTEEIDWDELCDLVMTPEEGQKNGDYFIRGFCPDERCDNNMQSSDLIIIDGDSAQGCDKGCVAMLGAHEVIKTAGFTHVIYTSYSNSFLNGINKWRLCIPCKDIVDKGTLAQGVAEIISLLHGRGLMVVNVKENNAVSQPWFLPRYHENPEDCDYRSFEGETYKLGNIEIVDSAMLGAKTVGNKLEVEKALFSWEDNVYKQFQAGTLHQGLLSAAGSFIRDSTWTNKQIKELLVVLVKSLCPDKEKVARACEGHEIDSLLKFCREKSGTNIVSEVSYKNYITYADVLEKQVFPEVNWAIEGLIPEGLTVLAGDPKVGKSLLAVNMCSSIASGTPVFGKQKTTQGTVIYMSFEDSLRLVQSRIKSQCDIWPNNFVIIPQGIPKLSVDFYKIIDELSMRYPDLRAIVIDTMSFIIPEKKPNTDDYKHYYQWLDPLHRWTNDNHVATIMITHKSKARKQDGDNPFASIIGSVAISGCSDCMMMLSRNHAKEVDRTNNNLPDGFLEVTGREIGSAKFGLNFDMEAGMWCLKHEIQTNIKASDLNKMLIFNFLQNASKGMGSLAVADGAQVGRDTTRSILSRQKKIVPELVSENDLWYWRANL